MNDSFEDRLLRVRDRMAAACERAGRAARDVRLLPVSKGFGPEKVLEAAGSGLKVFGESRVQEAAQKIALCPDGLTWHMVGHLQRNKVKPAVTLFRMIHAVDSIRLLETIDRECGEAGVRMPVCIEVNLGGEETKFGLKPDEVPAVLAAGNRCMNVEVVGLMAVPPFRKDPEDTRPYLRSLRKLAERMRLETGLDLPHLSMGMSHDMEVAIEEGATWVRVGSALFGERSRERPDIGETSI